MPFTKEQTSVGLSKPFIVNRLFRSVIRLINFELGATSQAGIVTVGLREKPSSD